MKKGAQAPFFVNFHESMVGMHHRRRRCIARLPNHFRVLLTTQLFRLSGLSCGMNIHSSSCSFYEHDKMSFYTMPTGHGVEVDDTPFRRRCSC